MPKISNDWLSVIAGEFEKAYYKELRAFLVSEYKNATVYPPADDIFNAFHMTSYKDVKVVILGQDPYHEEGQAVGLSFSVPAARRELPPSLVNIKKELADDLNLDLGPGGDLSSWASQGVLLLNSTLTVRAHAATSHAGKGWEIFTDNCLSAINDKSSPVVYILWGAYARAKKPLLTNPGHLVLGSPHPSPLSAHRGFFGCKHFSRANEFLLANGVEAIDWGVV